MCYDIIFSLHTVMVTACQKTKKFNLSLPYKKEGGIKK